MEVKAPEISHDKLHVGIRRKKYHARPMANYINDH